MAQHVHWQGVERGARDIDPVRRGLGIAGVVAESNQMIENALEEQHRGL